MVFREHSNIKKKKISLRRALAWIFFSTLLISGTTGFSLLYYFHIREIQYQDERYTITTLIIKKGERDILDLSYIAELLGLSCDYQTNLVGFNKEDAVAKLLSSPVIKNAEVRKIIPNTLEVVCKLREPRFVLLDFNLALIDDDGVLLPAEPFYHEINLPELYMGELPDTLQWGESVDIEKVHSAIELLTQLQPNAVKRIDVSKIQAPSYGQRQIVAILKEKDGGGEWLLRLKPGDYKEQINRFVLLRDTLPSHEEPSITKIIDLRVPKLAFIDLQ